MILQQIGDWDDAYENGGHIPGSSGYRDQWTDLATAFRNRMNEAGRSELDLPYGDGERNRFDLFHPENSPRGLVVFIHGGYWKALDKNFWSHLAEGALSHGYAVAMPSYTLCPDVRIADITQEIGAAVSAAAEKVPGSIRLTGHSAGGHLASRMVCRNTPLETQVLDRVERTVSISGVHDLRPIIRTAMNEVLRIDRAEALRESPALLEPVSDTRLVCWVGGGERAEFLRQNALLANIWKGLGAATASIEEPDRHHFNVLDGLTDPRHPLCGMLCG